MWTTPKTDWKATDSFMLIPDYDRIRENMKHIHGMAQRLYPDFGLLNMSNYTVDGLPYIEFFANVEGNLQQLYGHTLPRPHYSVKAMQENGSVWDFRDLNRIEETLKQMYNDLLAQEQAKPILRFKMGGGIFAAFI